MIINPELEAAREAARILFLPSALEVNSFAHGQAELIKFVIPEGNILDGIEIAELRVISIIIPCHRVVGTNGSLTGYAGGIEKKAALLRLEMKMTL